MISRGFLSEFGRTGRRAFVALLGCVAIFAQCLIAQTHVHSSAHSLSAAAIVAPDRVHIGADVQGGREHPSNAPSHSHRNADLCFLCQTALAGIGVLPATPLLALLDLRATEPQAAFAAPLTGILASHHWQGRAPPPSSALV